MPTFTMRLPDRDYEALQALSLVEGRSMAELVREAIVQKVESYVQQEDVQQKLEEDIQRRRDALKALVDRAS